MYIGIGALLIIIILVILLPSGSGISRELGLCTAIIAPATVNTIIPKTIHSAELLRSNAAA